MKIILLIEDNMDIRENTAEILELAGYTVISGENGKQGLELAQEHFPDLIICDVLMPYVDGFDVYKTLQSNPLTSSIPFIFLTAMSEKEEIHKGKELGVRTYLIKPFEDIVLLDAVEAELRTKTVSDFES